MRCDILVKWAFDCRSASSSDCSERYERHDLFQGVGNSVDALKLDGTQERWR
jgi:hypothetical protein